jgi:hypothetical protein
MRLDTYNTTSSYRNHLSDSNTKGSNFQHNCHTIKSILGGRARTELLCSDDSIHVESE